MCDRILIVSFFPDLLAGVKFQHNKNLSCQNNRGKAGKLQNSSIFNKEGNKLRMSLPQLGKNADHRHKVRLPFRISHLSAEVQVFRKSQHSSLSHYFLLF